MMAFVLSSVIILSALSVASGQDVYKNQGAILQIDYKNNTMVVNERHLVWNQNTVFYDSKGSPTDPGEFKLKSWVYIEGTTSRNNIILIEKIYLLPKYVGKKEKDRYPFMK